MRKIKMIGKAVKEWWLKVFGKIEKEPRYYKKRVSIFWFVVCAVSVAVTGLWFRSYNMEKQAGKKDTEESHIIWENKVPEAVKSQLQNSEECYLCGNSNRSLMGMFRKYDDLGIICVNDWYVLDMRIRNHDDSGNLLGAQGHINTTGGGLGEGKHSYYCSPNSDRGISDVTIYDGEDNVFDVDRVKGHLCQTCLDKVLEVMEVYAPENEPARPRDLCLVDFQTLELYSLQGDYSAYTVRDYYVQIDDSKEGEVRIMAFYAPVLENGHKAEE